MYFQDSIFTRVGIQVISVFLNDIDGILKVTVQGTLGV